MPRKTRTSATKPTTDEAITSPQDLQARVRDMLSHPRPATLRKRHLKAIKTLTDVQRELALLYADFHHRRVTHQHATKGAYMLACIGQALRMGQATPASSNSAKRDKQAAAVSQSSDA